MAEIRETHVERDEEGRVVDSKVTIDRPRRRGGGFGLGLLLGVIVIAGAIVAFADTTIQNTGEALEEAGENADRAANESDTATN